MREKHEEMVNTGRVVTVPAETLDMVAQSYPDLRSTKKAERLPILKTKISQLKSALREALNGLKGSYEFEVNGKVLEAKLYDTGVAEVMKNMRQPKANMLFSSAEIFRNAEYMYSTPDYDGNPNVYRWNYFYSPVQIGEDIVGVRIAVRDMALQAESQIYNWGIKKGATLGDGSRGQKVASPGASSVVPKSTISQNVASVNWGIKKDATLDGAGSGQVRRPSGVSSVTPNESVSLSGSGVNLNSAARTDPELAYDRIQLELIGATMGENGAKAITAAYDSATAAQYAPEVVAQSFLQVYNAARTGMPMSEDAAQRSAVLPAHIRFAAESAGEMDRLRDRQASFFGKNAGLVRDAMQKKSHISTKTERILDAVGKILGVQIRFVPQIDQGRANGMYENGVISIALDSSNPVQVVLTHEIVHRICETAPESYQTMVEFVERNMSGAELSLWSRAMRYKTSERSALTEEMVADAFGRLMGSDPLMQQFAQQYRSTAQKIADLFRDIIRAVQRVLNGQNVRLTKSQRLEFQDLEANLTDMRAVFTDAIRQAESLQNEGTKTAATEGGMVRYALKSYTPKQIENWSNSKKIVIYESSAQLRKFVDDAIAGKNLGKKIYFGAVSTELAEWIKAATEIDVEGFNCSLAATEIRKILSDHGTEATEVPRGQRPITPGDFQNIPVIVQNADTIKRSAKLYAGKPVINFVKNLNGQITVTAIVSNRHLDLTVQTMFAGKNKGNLAMPVSDQALTNTPEAGHGTVPSQDSVSKDRENVNGNLSRNKTDNETPNLTSEGGEKYMLKEEDNSAGRITADMSDEQRYEILKDKTLIANRYDHTKLKSIDVDGIEKLNKSEAEKVLKKLGDEFGVFKAYQNKDVDISFSFSKSNLNESLHKQKTGYSNFSKMMTVFDQVVENAVGIEVHGERYDNPGSQLKDMYVLVSAFKTQTGVVPVLMEVKEFKDETGNVLHLTVSLNEIKEADIVAHTRNPQSGNTSYAPSASIYRIADIFKNVNAEDAVLLKYAPDDFLNEEQLAAKAAEIERTQEYIQKKNARYKKSSRNSLKDTDNETPNLTPEGGVGMMSTKEARDAYAGKSLTEDSFLFSYDFLTSLPHMKATTLPDVDAVRDGSQRVDTRATVTLGMKNARAVGTERDGKVFVRNRYTGRQLLITSDSIRHGLNGGLNRLLTNARLGAVIGDVAKNAVPINALQNKAQGVTGTYAMAAYAIDSADREFVAILTVEQRGDYLTDLQTYDVARSVSGRQKNSSQASTKLQGFYPIKATEISIADFLDVVNSTHRSILSHDVLSRYGETRDEKGDYAGKVKFSLKDAGTAQKEITDQYQKAVDDVLAGTYGKSEPILMGYTPEVYRRLGVPSLPFVIGPGHVYSIAKTEAEARADGRYNKNVNYHGLGEVAVKSLYDKAMTEPMMVIAAKDEMDGTGQVKKGRSRSKHSVVAIVDVGSDGKSLLLPVEITAERTVNEQQMDVNVLSSAYEKKVAELVREAVAQENVGQIGVYYIKKEANGLLVDGVQFPKRLTEAMASTGIIHRIPENINMKIMEPTQSLQFKQWFGDWQNTPKQASKVVDHEGRPLVVYHGTNAEFNTFRSKDETYWFSESHDYAEAMLKERGGNRIIPVYLNMRNPYRATLEPGQFSDPLFEAPIIKKAKENGHDGVIITLKDDNPLKADTFYAVFSPDQIKSATDNVGTFDRKNPDVRYSLKEFDDGTRFVDVKTDQAQFDGLSSREMGRLAAKMIKERFAGKVIGLENRAYIKGRTATEYGFPAKMLGPDEHQAKMRAATELDNLLDAGTNFRTAPDGKDGHVHPEATGDFRYFDTIFKVGNQYYCGVINIMPTKNGMVLKDITKIRNITQDIRGSYGDEPQATFLRDASTDSVSKDRENVNGNLSRNETDNEKSNLTSEGGEVKYAPKETERLTQDHGQKNKATNAEGVAKQPIGTKNGSSTPRDVASLIKVPQDRENVNGKYSLRETFGQDVEKWIEETKPLDRIVSPGYFRVGSTSETLKSIGIKDEPIFWRKQKIGYIMLEHPEMDVDAIKSVPQLLENPIVVLKSRTREDSIVLFGDVRATNANHIMASILLTPKKGGGMKTEFALLSSAYSRTNENIKNLLKLSEYLYINPDKKRTDTWLMQLGVQFPSRQPVYGSIGSISYQNGKVNMKGVPFSVLGKENTETNGKISRNETDNEESNRTPEGGVRMMSTREARDAYAGKSLTEDSSLYSYDFLTSLPDMSVTLLPQVGTIQKNGKISAAEVMVAGMKNARAVGSLQNGKVFVKNAYTGRELRIDISSIRHGLNGGIDRLRTNARLGSVIGDVAKNAVPINALQNKAQGVTGTYAMAAYAIDSAGREFVAILTVEQRGDYLTDLQTYDVAHSVSGRQKKGSQASTKLQGVYPIKATTISIEELLRVVNSTHQSILSKDVLFHFDESRNPNGAYTTKVKFSMKSLGDHPQNSTRSATAEQTEALDSGEKGSLTPPLQDARFSLKNVHGKDVVWIEKSPFSNRELNNYKSVEAYITQHIGEVYTIIESGQKVYIGEDLPGEYTHSGYTTYLKNSDRPAFRAKNKATGSLGEMIEISTNRRWEKTKHQKSKDAKYGMYRYDTTFAFLVNGIPPKVRAYDAELLIRNASDGKKYLYDIVGIKENTAVQIDLTKLETRLAANKAAPGGSVSKVNIAQDNDTVKGNFLKTDSWNPAGDLDIPYSTPNKIHPPHDGATHLSLLAFEDGTPFVDVNIHQKQFDGLGEREHGRLATQILKNRVAGHVIEIDNPIVNHFDQDQHEEKLSQNIQPDNQFFDIIFKIHGGYYKGTVNISETEHGLILKDVTQIETVTQDISSTYGENPKVTILRDTSLDTIRQSGEKNKYRFSLNSLGDHPLNQNNAGTEETNYGREEVRLRDSGEWTGSAYPSGSVSPVEESTGGTSARQAQGRPADNGTVALTYGEKVSTASLGIGRGSIQANLRLVTGGETTATRKAKALAKKRDLRLTLFAGNNLRILQKDGTWASLRAYISGDRVFVRVDHPRYTADQLMRHEAGHDMIAKGEVNPDTVRRRIDDTFGREKADALAQLYVDAYEGSNLTAEGIWKEVICDSLGDMNIFSDSLSEDLADQLLTETKKAAAQSKMDTVRGPPSRAENKTSGERKYWRPNLNPKEWGLLNRKMEMEIGDSNKYLNQETKWLYANEKGTTVFAVYGIGDGSEGTPLYASGGKKAVSDEIRLRDYLEGKQDGAKTRRTALDRFFEYLKNQRRDTGGNIYDRTGTRDQDVPVSSRQSGSNGRGGTEEGQKFGNGTENGHGGGSGENGGRGGVTRFSIESPVEETADLPNPERAIGSDGAENKTSGERKYWRPNLNPKEWGLLNRKMEMEIGDSNKYLNQETKWLYANEKGTTVFAVYGIGDGTVPTPLYASGGKTAMADYARYTELREEWNNGTDRAGEELNRWLETELRPNGKRHRNYAPSQNRERATGNAPIRAGTRGRDGGRTAGTGPENGHGGGSGENGGHGGVTRFSIESPVEETADLPNPERAIGSDGAENKTSGERKYWRPNLNSKEWGLLNRKMETSGEQLDEATYWVYSKEKGTTVFAVYGIGDGTENTPLYAVGGKKAERAGEAMKRYMEGIEHETDRDGATFDRWIETMRRKQRHGSGHLSDAGNRGKYAGDVRLYRGTQERDGGRTAGTGAENEHGGGSRGNGGHGGVTRFSIESPVEETADLTELERAIGSDEVLENNVEGAKFRRKVDTSRLLDYDAMTDRPDMHLVEIDDSVEHTVDSKTRKDIVRNAIENAAEIGSTNSSGGVSVYVNDIGRNILLSTHGLQHGLDRRLKKNAAVTLQAGKLLQNAILINELTPKQNQAAESYVLLGAGKANENIYIVEFVVNQYNNEVASIDVLYSLNTKKEPAVLNAPAIAEKPLRITDSNISIAQLLHLASRYFPDILPESVLRHYGYDRRPDGILGESALFSREVESVESLREQN